MGALSGLLTARIAGPVVLVLAAGHRVAAIQSFAPECTLPPPETNSVSGPNTRSTLSILWNCLSIIILCTWTIQHLNVPAIRREPNGLRQKLWWHILDSMTKLKWMTLAILIPEYLVGRALGEWRAALGMKRYGWNITEAYMANMGYFVLDTGSESPAVKKQEEKLADATVTERGANPDIEPAIPGSDHPFHDSDLAEPEDQTLSKSDAINLRRLRCRFWALNADQWDTAVARGIADRPNVPRSQLEKLDRGGALVKAIALIQVVYLAVQLIARKVNGLPSTQLEIAALAFAASSAVTYALYWSRPQGVETIHIIKAKPRYNSKDELVPLPSPDDPQWNVRLRKDLDMARPHIVPQRPMYLWLGHRGDAVLEPDLGPVPIPNDASHLSNTYSKFLGGNDETATLAFGAVVGGILFGGLHCLAWNFEFPTPAEKTVWRICAVTTTALPFLTVVPLTIWMRLNPYQTPPRHGPIRTIVGVVILFGCILPYVLARLVIMVEVFRTLGYLPPEAYRETWSGSFPSWG